LGNNPSQIARQYLSNPQEPYNPATVQQTVAQIRKSGDNNQKTQLNQLLNNMVLERQYEKYTSLLSNSLNTPKWLVEKQNADNSRIAKISFVKETYSSVPDSTIKITDAEISDYIGKNSKQFKQQESRTIAFVSFSASPSASDSATVLAEVSQLKEKLAAADSVPLFLASEGANYFDGYMNGKKILFDEFNDKVNQEEESLKSQGYPQTGALNQQALVVARMMGSKVLPDSVKCRHVLISTDIANGGYADSAASAKIDSIKNAIQGGANWGQMVNQYNPQSDGSRQSAGEMTFSSTQIQAEGFAPEFAKFILFDGKPGERKVVKTSFGYHYIEIQSFIKPTVHYKVAYLPREIVASQETDNAALNQANEFAAESRDQKAFEANYEKKWKAQGKVRNQAPGIPAWSSEIPGLGISRSFVRAIYEADLGEVLKPERIDNNYVVAAVSEVFEEGTMSVEKARASVEPLLRNRKKATVIQNKIGNISTLEAAASALGGKTIEVADSLRISGGQNPSLGFEPRVIGAAFNAANTGKVVNAAIPGMNGVYVVRVEQQGTTPVTAGDLQEQRKARTEQAKQALNNQYSPNNPVGILRNAAEIKDYRSKRY